MKSGKKEKTILLWSGGRDSAAALYETVRTREYEIVAFFTRLTEDYQRTCMHGVRRLLLEQQADALGRNMERIFLSSKSTNEAYETKMAEVLEQYGKQGVSTVISGDIFLEDLRKYRESRLAGVGMKAVFPLWGKDTGEFARSFIQLEFKTVVTCVDTQSLDRSFVGQPFDEAFLSRLPDHVDPCGENGEFHSFVFDGPLFETEIKHNPGEVVFRDNRYYYCDLVPK